MKYIKDLEEYNNNIYYGKSLKGKSSRLYQNEKLTKYIFYDVLLQAQLLSTLIYIMHSHSEFYHYIFKANGGGSLDESDDDDGCIKD